MELGKLRQQSLPSYHGQNPWAGRILDCSVQAVLAIFSVACAEDAVAAGEKPKKLNPCCWGHEGPFRPLQVERPLLYRGLCQASSYRRRLALRLTCHTGLSLLFEVGVRPPHDGMRRMGRPNLSGAFAAD